MPEVSKKFKITFRVWRNVPQACCSGWVILSVTSLLSSSADLDIVGRNCWRSIKLGKLFFIQFYFFSVLVTCIKIITWTTGCYGPNSCNWACYIFQRKLHVRFVVYMTKTEPFIIFMTEFVCSPCRLISQINIEN